MKFLSDNKANTGKVKALQFLFVGQTRLAILFSLLKNLDSRSRLGVSIMVGMAAFIVMPDFMHLDIQILAAWISGVLCFLMLFVLMANSATPQKTYYLAQGKEAQHSVTFFLVIITACTSIFAIGLMETNNQDISASGVVLEVSLSLIAVLCSWFLTHTVFVLHYATCYYRREQISQEEKYVKGLNFPGEEEPDYWDFMYFSFTLGMTAQTSDVSITSLPMRQLVLGHAIVSFLFYMVILGSSVNVVSGLI
ncbi:MAG: DUF1345 domain-containing protein [Pelatocladus maniniholoensis HA4357-MV3]|jgi:uncharacterized membrane protein|uniref:DUF1345 domain-containing protein n=1 Tax=Pelatocladus maniniholoensis HA4357-MV3 TaxID=1117104 RepID=A0A9E3H550_9NOST|nr:DUF1345 domain-containing protein [Pelatocladus maniniholoensis HA4357-MV3]BAZ70644.1 hypothetical protein NIES4106_54390 [Fischerella sp. NIES-4106]